MTFLVAVKKTWTLILEIARRIIFWELAKKASIKISLIKFLWLKKFLHNRMTQPTRAAMMEKVKAIY